MTKWTYHFETVGGDTEVTESFEMLCDMPWYFRFADRFLMGVKDRKADLVSSMEATLQRLRTATEDVDKGFAESVSVFQADPTSEGFSS